MPKRQGARVDYQGEKSRLLVQRCITDARNNPARMDRDRQDWQNSLFYRGGSDNHWSVYDRSSGTYVPRGNDPEQGGLPDWVPRPATNHFAVTIDQIAAILDQSEPAKLFGPSTDDDEDRATAEVAEDADPVLLEEIGYDRHRAQLNKLVTLTSGAAYIVFYDTDPKHGMGQIDLIRCATCQVEMLPMELEDNGNECPGLDDAHPCGAPGDAFEPVIDMFGKPMGVPEAKGKMCGQVVPSFEYSLPSTARVADSKSVPWVLTHSGMPKEDVIGRWPKAKEALGKAGNGGHHGGISRQFARAMRQLSSPSRANAPTGSVGGAAIKGDEPVVYILHHDPIDDGEFYFPDGLLCVMVEDVVVEVGPLPVIDDEDRAIKNVLIRSYAHAPGTAFGKPPADDLVPLQISYNLVDSLIQLILMHDAAPRTYIPLSVTLENQPSGRPGENIYYRSVLPGEKPTSESGINPPEGLYKYLEILEGNFQKISKLNSVLSGARPEGDPTLGEVQRLEENGMRSFKEPLSQQITFEKDLSRLCLFIAKRSAWSDRFRRIRGDNGEWEVRQFNASDLNGKIDIQIDSASAWPKSPTMRMLKLKQAFDMSILPPAMQDPELQTKLLTELDLLQVKPSLNADRKQITRELAKWKAARSPADILPPNPDTQELPIHYFFKKQFLKTEEFEDLMAANPPVAQAMVAHVAMIQQIQQQQAMAAAAAANPQPPAPPDDRTNVDKGDHSAVEDAVSSGALRPAGGEPQGDPMGDAVGEGALVPAGAAPQGPTGPSIDQLMAMGALAPAPPEGQGAVM